MKSKMNIKSIIIMFAIAMVSMFFINISFAANTGKISVETANLRESASVDSKILELISLNEEVEIIEKSNGWYKVKYKGIKGYLREDLLTVNGKVAETTNTENTSSNEEKVQNTTEPEKGNESAENITEVQSEKQENLEQPQEETSQVSSNVQEENGLGKYKVVEDTVLKIIPTINATNIAEVKKDEQVNATEIINGWTWVETRNIKGWIRQEKLVKDEGTETQEQQPEQEVETSQPEEQEKPEQTVQSTAGITNQQTPVTVPQNTTKKQYVNWSAVNLREKPNTNCEVLLSVNINTEVEVLSEANGWSKVKVNGMEGYISTSLLSDKKTEITTNRGLEESRKPIESNKSTTTETKTQETSKPNTSSSATSTSASAIIATANKYLGSKYVYGGTSPSGFDCSGFTQYVYKQHGITLNRTAAAQYSNGVAVSKSQLQIGDLVMFGKSGINHVGIYIGGGQIIHAANPSRGVTTDTINSGYYCNNYVGARRVL